MRTLWSGKNALQGAHCGGKENDTLYPAAGGEYAPTRILFHIFIMFVENEGNVRTG